MSASFISLSKHCNTADVYRRNLRQSQVAELWLVRTYTIANSTQFCSTHNTIVYIEVTRATEVASV